MTEFAVCSSDTCGGFLAAASKTQFIDTCSKCWNFKEDDPNYPSFKANTPHQAFRETHEVTADSPTADPKEARHTWWESFLMPLSCT